MAANVTFKLIKALSRPEMVFALAHVPGSKRLIFGGSDFLVYEVDLAPEKPEPRAFQGGGHQSYVTSLALAGRLAVSGGYDGRLIWWNVDWGDRVRAVEAHSKWVRDVAASPDGSLIASVADDMVCRVWDAETGARRHELRGHAAETPHHFPSMLYACAFSPDGNHLATGDKVGHIIIWDVASGKPAATLDAGMYTWDPTQRRHSIGGIRALAFSPDGRSLAVGGIGKIGNIDHLEGPSRIEIFDWRQGERTHEFSNESLKGLIERLLFDPDGNRLLGAGGANDGFLTVLDLKAKSVLASEKASSHVHDATFGDTPNVLFTAAHGKISEYEIKS